MVDVHVWVRMPWEHCDATLYPRQREPRGPPRLFLRGVVCHGGMCAQPPPSPPPEFSQLP